MGYQDRLEAAAVWLQSIQRHDGGWGLAADQSSSLVNTAEALFVLRRARFMPAAVQRGLDYIRSRLDQHLGDAERGRRVRYVAFSLLAYHQFRDVMPEAEVSTCVDWLMTARNNDAGWGHEARDQKSSLFTTALSMWMLREAGVPRSKLDASEQFVLGLAERGTGWYLQPRDGTNAVANAFGLLALDGHHDRDERVIAARQSLLQTTHWGFAQESVPGTVWSHSTFAWALPELVKMVDSPFAPVVAEAIRYINSLATSVGWSETPGAPDVTVRSQFWATKALSAVQSSFDPARHALRVEATMAQDSLREPEFVKIAMHSPWATIVPSRGYRLAVAMLVLTGISILYGGFKALGQLPHRADAAMSLIPLTAAYLLVRKRPKLFPRIAVFAGWLIAGMEAFHLIFGVSVSEIAETLQHLPKTLGGLTLWR